MTNERFRQIEEIVSRWGVVEAHELDRQRLLQADLDAISVTNDEVEEFSRLCSERDGPTRDDFIRFLTKYRIQQN